MRPIYKKIILIIGDLICLFASLLTELMLRYGSEFTPDMLYLHLWPFSLLFLTSLVIFYVFDLYELKNARPSLNFYATLIISLVGVTTLGAIFFYFVPMGGIFPKINLLLTFALGAAMISLWRGAFFAAFQDSIREKIAIVNYNSLLAEFFTKIAGSAEYDITYLIETPQVEGKNPDFPGYEEKMIPVQKLLKQKDLKTDIIILGENTEDLKEWLPKISQALNASLVWDIPSAYEAVLQKIPLECVDVLWFAKFAETKKKDYERFKRIIDIIASVLFLIIGIPFFIIIGICIWIEDRGPAFYIQERVGKNRKVFNLIKFRSMSVNAEADGKALWASKNDSRVTKTGIVIRLLHLDELPQMINILKGDISLIGPRPERPEFVKQLEKEIQFFGNRHLIKPGFTGWAQIKFRYARSVLESREKYEYDLFYIKNRSLMLDFKILLKTVQLFFKRD